MRATISPGQQYKRAPGFYTSFDNLDAVQPPKRRGPATDPYAERALAVADTLTYAEFIQSVVQAYANDLASLDDMPLDQVDRLLLDFLEFGSSQPPGWVLERFDLATPYGPLTMEQANAIDLGELAPYPPAYRLDVIHVDALAAVNAIPLDRLATTGGWQED